MPRKLPAEEAVRRTRARLLKCQKTWLAKPGNRELHNKRCRERQAELRRERRTIFPKTPRDFREGYRIVSGPDLQRSPRLLLRSSAGKWNTEDERSAEEVIREWTKAQKAAKAQKARKTAKTSQPEARGGAIGQAAIGEADKLSPAELRAFRKHVKEIACEENNAGS